MIRLILLLAIFISLAFTQPRFFNKTIGTSTAASTNVRGSLRTATPPKAVSKGPKPSPFSKTSSEVIASLKTTPPLKTVSQGPRPLHFPKSNPKSTTSSVTTLKFILQGTPLHFQKLTPKAITSSRTILKTVIQGTTPLHYPKRTPKTTTSLKTTASPLLPGDTPFRICSFYDLARFVLWNLARKHKTTPSSKSRFTELQMFLVKLDTDYEGRYGSGNVEDWCNFLDGIQEGLKHVWSEIMKDGQKHSSDEMSDLQKFLKKVVEDYNLCIEHHFYANSEAAWKNYIIAFGKKYKTEEEGMRKAIFMKNKESVEEGIELFRNDRVSYATKLNHLSDRTREELEGMKGFRPRKLSSKSIHPSRMVPQNETRYYHGVPDSDVPISVDWQVEGYVTPVKFQGDCSSCYAFAGIGALEAYHKKRTGNLISLSVQNILDCTWNLGNDGCKGGFIHSVFENAQTMGIESEDRYPYTMNASSDCQWKKEHVAVLLDGYLHTVTKGNELALEHAIANHGPVAAAIGTRGGFESYGYGIFDPPECGPADHSVLIVGYGTDPIQGDYWIIKNSYGEWWGEDGYIRIARNKNNVCNVASHVVFPIFADIRPVT